MAAPDTQIKVGGSWTSIDDCKAKIASTWEQVDVIWAKIAGTWEKVWEALVISLDDTTSIDGSDSAGNGNLALSSVRVKNDGTVEEAGGSTGAALTYSLRENWAEPPSASIGDSYHVRLTQNSTSGASGNWTGSARGSWLALTSDRTWTWEKDTDVSGTATVNVTLAISDDGGSTTLTSATFDMNSEEVL